MIYNEKPFSYGEKLPYEVLVSGGREVDMSFLSYLQHTELIKHCRDAMYMSYYKYDHINQFVGDNALVYKQYALKAYEKDKNAEHIVDAVNYCMIRQMFYPSERDQCLQQAMELDRIYREEDFKGSDSKGSTKPVSVREDIYSRYSNYGKPPKISDGHIKAW